MRLICREDSLERLLSELALHSVDILLSEAPVTSTMKVRAFNHLLGEFSVSILGTKELAKKYRRGFRFIRLILKQAAIIGVFVSCARADLERAGAVGVGFGGGIVAASSLFCSRNR